MLTPYVVSALMVDALCIEGKSLADELVINYKKWKEWRKDADIPFI